MRHRSREDRAGSLVGADSMVGPDDIATNGILHASPVSQVIPGCPDRSGAHGGKEPDQNDLCCPGHYGFGMQSAQSPVRNAPTPMPISPLAAPVVPVPAVTAAVTYQLDRRGEARVAHACLGRRQRSTLDRNSRENHQAATGCSDEAHYQPRTFGKERPPSSPC
jgi:hypothetical protein